MSAERQLLMQLERLSRMDTADRVALPADADSSGLRESLRFLEALENVRIPPPSLDAQWLGRAALLAAVKRPRQRFFVLPLAPFPRRLVHVLSGAALATVLVATAAGAAALAGVGAPRATVNEVLSALGINDQAVRPVETPPASPAASPKAGQDNLTWPPDAFETSIPIGLPGPDETPVDAGPQEPEGSEQEPQQSAGVPVPGGSNPGHGGENPGQGADNPGHGGENPGQGVGPDGSGTPPGQSGENPGHGGENPGQGQENQAGGTPPGQGGDNPGQGSGNGNGHGNKP